MVLTCEKDCDGWGGRKEDGNDLLLTKPREQRHQYWAVISGFLRSEVNFRFISNYWKIRENCTQENECGARLREPTRQNSSKETWLWRSLLWYLCSTFVSCHSTLETCWQFHAVSHFFFYIFYNSTKTLKVYRKKYSKIEICSMLYRWTPAILWIKSMYNLKHNAQFHVGIVK